MDQEKNTTITDETAVQPEAAQAKEKPVRKIRSRKKKQTQIPVRGTAYILSTYNNTVVTITDQNGNALAWSSAGKVGFKGPKKATAYAAGVIVKDVVPKLIDQGLREVDVFIKGVGTGRESAIRSLNSNGLKIISIKDVTPIPHNGCRPKKVRRV
ncbi:MAG TPA: 30S ribosomal protein S11 [Patescibacteria group bacterium]